MKQLITIIGLTLAFFTGSAKSLYQHEPTSEKLVLNNGSRWKIDKFTKNNVANLKMIVKMANGKTVKSLEDYRKAGVALQNGIIKMIRECRMKGPNHLALHKWLEPLIGKVANLNRASDATAAAYSYDAIISQLNLFDQYFQV